MKKNKKLQLIQKKIKSYINMSKKNIKKIKTKAKKIKKNNIKILKNNFLYFKIIAAFFVLTIIIIIVFTIFIKNEFVKNIDFIKDKEITININDDLIDNTLFINENSNKIISISVWNTSSKEINTLSTKIRQLDELYCDLLINDFGNEIYPISSSKTVIWAWETNNYIFEINPSTLKDNWFFEIKFDCKENAKRNEKFSNKINIEYKKIYLKNKNILILNTTLEPISKNLSNFYKIYSNNWNKVKYMSSIYISNLKNYKDKDLTNKIVFFSKVENETQDIFKNMYENIIKNENFNYINWYEIIDLTQKNIKSLYFLWDCSNIESKCNPYNSYDNYNIYYNYFSPKLLDNKENNIDYIILIPAKFN